MREALIRERCDGCGGIDTYHIRDQEQENGLVAERYVGGIHRTSCGNQ